MSRELLSIDVTASPELLRLAEEVQRSGVGRVLRRGDHDIAVITPIERAGNQEESARPSEAARAEHDCILNIIGIGESAEPTDIAHHKREYLADAYDADRHR